MEKERSTETILFELTGSILRKCYDYVCSMLAVMLASVLGKAYYPGEGGQQLLDHMLRDLITRIDMTAQTVERMDERLETLETHCYAEEIEKVKNGEHFKERDYRADCEELESILQRNVYNPELTQASQVDRDASIIWEWDNYKKARGL